ncbi:MAG: hypothetical protein ABSB19_12090 [Methylomonas sp.]
MQNFINKRLIFKLLPLTAAIAGIFAPANAHASLTASGDVEPANPSTWSNATTAYIGATANAAIAENNGSVVPTIYQSYLGYNTGVTGSLSVDGAGTAWLQNSSMYDGYNGIGSVSVTNGGSVSIGGASFLGYGATGAGSLSISGAGSSWTESGALNVGGYGAANGGSGYLSITQGGGLTLTGSAGSLDLGNSASQASTSVTVVDGAGSEITTGGNVVVGAYTGAGAALSLSDDASINANNFYVNTANSTFYQDIGAGSSVIVGRGSGTVANAGTIQFVVGAGVSSGMYTPITAGNWTGAGAVQALGGEWNAASHSVTVGNAAITAPGLAASIDTSATQSILVSDTNNGAEVGASFLGTSASNSITFGATEIGGAELGSLLSKLTTGQTLLSGWDFTSSGIGGGSPVYLSFYVGNGFNYSQFLIWQLNGSTWSQYAPANLAYNNGFVSFTANNLDSYAIGANVPLPGAAWLFGGALAGFGLLSRRKAV